MDCFPRDYEDVLEADEGDEVGHDAHLGVHVEAESREAERHEDGAEDGEDGAEGDAELGSDQLDLGAREVHVAELQRHYWEKIQFQAEGSWKIFRPEAGTRPS